MPLSLNEIRDRAAAFSKEWKHEGNEHAEAKSFWDGFFNVFGISRRRVAIYEQHVTSPSLTPRPLQGEREPKGEGAIREGSKKHGFIDLFWKGVLLVEHKSKGQNLDRAYEQAKDYFPGLNENELPRYILVCDFERFRLYDLEDGWQREFRLDKLADHINLFGFISGYKQHVYKEQDPVNIKAAELMGKLHDQLKAIGYAGHELEVYLVRLLFCLFADDTNIFDKGIFQDYIELHTAVDGSDLAGKLAGLFEVLDQPEERRLKNLSETVAAFPYVNGKLFKERLPMASFDAKMRKILLDCCYLDWSRISPAIFGSLFQSVMDDKARRNLGAHYTSEKNILKLIKPLFLDELTEEFEKVKKERPRLDEFHIKLSKIRILDPACGCGNFLIIAYRELRLLEIEVLKAKFKNQIATHIEAYVNVNVDQFYGIEYEEFPAQIAQVAMWLIDHQMNQVVSEAFGEYYRRLPLVKSATIVQGNSLRIDWQSLLGNEDLRYDYILGNPPFLGKTYQNEEQKKDMQLIFKGVDGAGVLDYVTAWYIKASQYMDRISDDNWNTPKTECAFVSTNSISQGEQVGVLWNELFNKYHIKIHFAHRTFKWGNEAKGNAAVHVVIIGFANYDTNNKKIFGYEHVKGDSHEIQARNINPYLIEGKDEFVIRRSKPICKVPQLIWGNKPTDGGNFLFNDKEKDEFVKTEPKSEKWFKKFIGSEELINNISRWCLWLKDIPPSELKAMPKVLERVKNIKELRIKSTKKTTVQKAATPTLFDEIRHTGKDYLAIPEVSSERRAFLPIGYVDKDTISSNKIYMLPNCNHYYFGILASTMHMSWIKHVTGRLKSDISYSTGIVYNNFPWPENPSEKNVKAVEVAAQAVLDARAMFPDSSLADLYDPNTMPPALVKAHQALDKAVDLCYRPQAFLSETKRIEYLFELYDRYTAGLFAPPSLKKLRRTKG